ncbi:glycosyltransferase family 2 protein [Leisingera sp. McT4-56]|uniref:glycosyltransferase family 2 protein n=1 Tax=Leisingera sp. McT4-56 TaxID=2881255 RepID=UPI001CF91E0D|nr:glycosyltransferase [Leisingera sp. McT4-56]MCB4457209.1 glycosyltransferase [Leisingera sp. McT4-56]
MDYPKISMVIGSFNRRKLLQLCIDAVRKELEGESYEIIVVDGGSTDGTVEWLTQQKDIISLIQHNRGEWNGKKIDRKPWAYFMNLAFKCASGKYICMLSDDSLIVPGAIVNGVDLFDEMLEQGVKLGGVAFYFRDYPVRKKYAVAINVGNLYVNHGLYLNAAMKEVGYCDEDYHFYFSDTDLCLKMKAAGYRVIRSKTSFVEHYFEATPEIRASNNDDRKEQDRMRLISKWAGTAYPEGEREKYEKIVGYWDYHPRGFDDPLNTIQRLIDASAPD